MNFRVALFISCLLLGGNALAANPLVKIRTNVGEMTVELYQDKAPQTVSNFLSYVNNGFYKGTIFHRVIDRFVIQGGGFTDDFKQKETLPPIRNEADNGLANEPGTLSMARTYEPHSATAQFFINLESNKHLNFYKPVPDYYGYCVFGKVVQGMDVAKKIGAIPTAPGGPFEAEVPTTPVVIEEVALLSQAKEEKTVKSRKPRKKEKSQHG